MNELFENILLDPIEIKSGIRKKAVRIGADDGSVFCMK